jgi:hypothetical protein
VPAAAGDLTPGEISALSRAGYGRNDGDGRFWNDDDKKVVKAAAVTRDKGEVVRMVSLRSVTHFQPRSPRQRLGSALLLAFRDALQRIGHNASGVWLDADRDANRRSPRSGRDTHAWKRARFVSPRLNSTRTANRQPPRQPAERMCTACACS